MLFQLIFFIADISVGQQRHLIFVTQHQLHVLARAKTWYVDDTFRLLRKPFTQIFTINIFLRAGDNTKQVSLMYVLMSGKPRADYCAVFAALLDQLPDPPAVVSITADFEVGM